MLWKLILFKNEYLLECGPLDLRTDQMIFRSIDNWKVWHLYESLQEANRQTILDMPTEPNQPTAVLTQVDVQMRLSAEPFSTLAA